MSSRKKHRRRPLSCPLCGQKLVPRTGRFGRFLGCILWPDCRGSRNLPQRKRPASAARKVVRRSPASTITPGMAKRVDLAFQLSFAEELPAPAETLNAASVGPDPATGKPPRRSKVGHGRLSRREQNRIVNAQLEPWRQAMIAADTSTVPPFDPSEPLTRAPAARNGDGPSKTRPNRRTRRKNASLAAAWREQRRLETEFRAIVG